MKQLLIADDHEMVRHGLRRVLETRPDWVICGEASSGPEAVALTRQLKPDVLVLDFAMPGLNGLEVTRQVRAACPQTQVLILTMHESDQLGQAVFACGARGLVLKSDAGTTLVTAVEHLLEQRPYCTPRASPLVLETFLRPEKTESPEPPGGMLTPRERQIVGLIADGRASKQVADALGISVATVETHRANLMRKLNIHSVSELVRYAIREHIVAP